MIHTDYAESDKCRCRKLSFRISERKDTIKHKKYYIFISYCWKDGIWIGYNFMTHCKNSWLWKVSIGTLSWYCNCVCSMQMQSESLHNWSRHQLITGIRVVPLQNFLAWFFNHNSEIPDQHQHQTGESERIGLDGTLCIQKYAKWWHNKLFL